MCCKKRHGGYLVAVEGIDGTGKSTQVRLVAQSLRGKGLPVVTSKEPTDGYWGKLLTASATNQRLSQGEELEIFIEDRKEHVEKVIGPALALGEVVILDRYYFSSVAYQGGNGILPSEILKRNEEIAPRPNLLVIIDIEPETAMSRLKIRDGQTNSFETATSLANARAIFNSLDYPFLLRLNGLLPIATITGKIVSRVCDDLLDPI